MPASDIKVLLRIPVEVDIKLRERAGVEGRSLNAVICEILRESPDGGKRGGSQGKSGAVDGGAKKDRSGARANEKTTATDLTGDRQEHDVKTCRLYGCLKCKAAGKKF